ncbi:MAG: hypothetical protein JW874_12525 [Spirochaetales bacterium]|nr:hypothetical protein [Spirochaetales bacterium]
MITIFSGARDSGKTTKMEKYYSILQENKRGDGIFSKKVFLSGECIGYDFFQCATEISVPGLRLKNRLPDNWQEEWPIGRFSMSARGFHFASSVLRQCILNNGPAMWMDEIGRLELDRNGFYGIVEAACKRSFNIYLSCRTDFLQELIGLFSLSEYQIIAC